MATPKKSPYRTLAIVPFDEPDIPQRERLTECPACRVTFCNVEGIVTKNGTYDNFQETFCAGKRYGFLWLRACKERRPHMHQSCIQCGAKWIVRPDKDAYYG